MLHGGGHASTNCNVLVGIKLNTANPTWQVISPPTVASLVQSDDSYANTGRYLPEQGYALGKMCTGHSFCRPVFLQALDRYVRPGSGVSYTGRGGATQIDSFDFAQFIANGAVANSSPTFGWLQSNTLNTPGGYYGSPQFAVGDTMWTTDAAGAWFCQYNSVTTTFAGNWGPGGELYGATFVDTLRSACVWMGELQNGTQLVRRFNGASNFIITGTPIPANAYGGGCYDSSRDKYLVLVGGAGRQVYEIDPVAPFACRTFPNGGIVSGVPFVLPEATSGRTVGSRFQYLPELRCVVFQEGHNYGGAVNGDGKRPGRLLMMRIE